MGIWICLICFTWSILMINCSAVNMHKNLWKRGTEGVWPCGAQTLLVVVKLFSQMMAKQIVGINTTDCEDCAADLSRNIKRYILIILNLLWKNHHQWLNKWFRKKISLTTQLSETVTVKNSISVINNLPVMQQTYCYLYILSLLFISYEKLDEWHSKLASKSY